MQWTSSKIVAGILATALALPGAVQAETVQVDESVCNSLTAHQPAGDVAYQPDVDVDGNALVPVDANSAGSLDLAAEHEYWLQLDIPLEELLDIGADSNLDRIRAADLSVGTVTLQNGELFFNGERLGSESAHAIAEACSRLQH